jgi:hypothetical protein
MAAKQKRGPDLGLRPTRPVMTKGTNSAASCQRMMIGAPFIVVNSDAQHKSADCNGPIRLFRPERGEHRRVFPIRPQRNLGPHGRRL